MTDRTIKVEADRRLSNEEITTLMLMLDPDLTHIELSEKFSDSPFVFYTNGGAVFEGIVTYTDANSIRLRQEDGKEIAIFKRFVAAVRRPVSK